MKKDYSLGEIAEFLHAELCGDASLRVNEFSPIEEAKSGSLTFLASQKYEKYLATTMATGVLISKKHKIDKNLHVALIRVDDPYLAFAKVMQQAASELHEARSGIAESAVIAPNVKVPETCYIGEGVILEEDVILGEGVELYPYCFVGKGTTIGDRTRLYPRVTLYPGVEIGSYCIIHAGAVIGSDGFGFAPSPSGYEKIPQLGTVKIADFVEIGANTTIDRSVMGATWIDEGVKIDNLVQVGHNSTIGAHTVISAQVGISGSTKLGAWCRIGGQVGFAGHQSIGDHSEIAAQSGVAGKVAPHSRLIGSPQMPVESGLRALVMIQKLPELDRSLRELRKELDKLQQKCNNTH